MNATSRWRETPVWRQMEMGADLFPTVVNWVVIFEPLVKKIGCHDKEMCDAYLRVRDSSNLFCITKELARPCKNDAIFCHASLEQPLFEIKVYIWAGEDGGWDTPICFASCKNAQTYAKRKCHLQWVGSWWFQYYHFMRLLEYGGPKLTKINKWLNKLINMPLNDT